MTLPKDWQPGEEHGYAEPPNPQDSDTNDWPFAHGLPALEARARRRKDEGGLLVSVDVDELLELLHQLRAGEQAVRTEDVLRLNDNERWQIVANLRPQFGIELPRAKDAVRDAELIVKLSEIPKSWTKFDFIVAVADEATNAVRMGRS